MVSDAAFSTRVVGALPFSTVTLQLAFLLLKERATTVAVPGATPVRLPAASTATMPGLALWKVTVPMPPLGKDTPSWRVWPTPSTGSLGVMAILLGAFSTCTLHTAETPL